MKQESNIVKPVLLATAFADAGPLDEMLRLKILKAAFRCRQKTGTTPGLYVRISRNDVAWVCYTVESIQTYQADQTKQAERYPSLIGWQKICALAESHGAAFDARWIPEPEVGFVALNKEHIDDLISKGHTKARHFPGWLCEGAPMSRVWFASDGAFLDVAAPVFIRSSQRGSRLDLQPYSRPEPQNSESAIGADAVDQPRNRPLSDADDALASPDFIVNTIPDGFEHETEIWLRDVYVDRSVVLYLREVHGLPLPGNDWDVIQMRARHALQSSPFNLKNRVFGVEVMYDVARMQFGSLVAGGDVQQPPNEDVVQAFVSCDKKLFNKSERAIQAAKLIRPNKSRSQGLHNGERRDFTSTALNILKNEYSLRGSFVSDSLALIVHATKQWQEWEKETPAGASGPFALRSELMSYGFKGEEVEAIFMFITSPGPQATSKAS